MAINTVAIQEVIDELEARRASDLLTIENLKALLPQLVDPPVKAPRTPRAAKNGGAEKGKPGPARAATPAPGSGKGIAKNGYRKNCDKHGPYVGTGARSGCPACNPRIVSARDVA